MASKPKDAVVGVVDFDSPEYDAQFEDVGTQEGGEGLQEQLQAAVASACTVSYVLEARQAVVEQAVDHAIKAALTTIDMLYVARDDHAVTQISLVHGSWDPEPVLEPCNMDTWLRAAIPETSLPEHSFMLQEFLKNGAQPGAPPASGTIGKDAKRMTGTGDLQARPQPAGKSSSPVGKPEGSPALRGSRSMKQPVAAYPRKQLSPRQEAAEQRLREELEIRRAQLAVAASMEAKDAEARANLTKISQELKGREYSYDHNGKVVPLAQLGPDSHASHSGPQFDIKSPGDNSPGKARRLQPSPSHKDGGKGGKSGKSGPASGSTDRKLTNDFREAPPKTQPNALEVMAPSGGVTLRSGAHSKTGPPRAGKQGMGMSRADLERYAATVRIASKAQPSGPTTAPAARQVASKLAAADHTSADPGVALSPARSESDAQAVKDTGRAAPAVATVKAGALTFSEGVLSHLPASPDITHGSKVRSAGGAAAAGQKPATPDINPALVTASDWGRSAGTRAHVGHASLETSKPSQRDRELEVGRSVRLPRDRVSHATGSPPLSPAKLLAQTIPAIPPMTFAN